MNATTNLCKSRSPGSRASATSFVANEASLTAGFGRVDSVVEVEVCWCFGFQPYLSGFAYVFSN